MQGQLRRLHGLCLEQVYYRIISALTLENSSLYNINNFISSLGIQMVKNLLGTRVITQIEHYCPGY